MRLRRIFYVLLLAAFAGQAVPSQAAPLTVGALGPVTLTGWASCTASTVGIDFEWNNPEFLLQTGYFPTVATALNGDCALLVEKWNQFGNRFPEVSVPCGLPAHYSIKPDKLTVSGNTYTVTNRFRDCNGVFSDQTTRLVIGATTIAFSQTYQHSDGYRFTAIGTLTRVW